MSGPIPRWKLERLALEEPQEPVSPETAAALAEIERQNAAFFAQNPAERIVPRIEARLAAAHTHHRRNWALAAATAFALVIGFVALSAHTSPEDGVRIKAGAPMLTVHRQRGEQQEELVDGATVHQGETLQLSYAANGRRYGAIVSVDGLGHVTLHHPTSPNAPAVLEQNRQVALSTAFRLDGAPRFERFFFITSERPFDAAMLTALKPSLSDRPEVLPLGDEFEQTIFTLKKDDR